MGAVEKKKNTWLGGALLLVILLLIDMVTKIIADAHYDVGDPFFKIIPGYLEWGLAYNRGISFSMGSDAPIPAKIALVAATGVLFVVFAIYYLKLDPRRKWVRVALVFIVAGGIGNLIDRVYYQVWEPFSVNDPSTWDGVRDMVRLKIFTFDFGVCNFADFFIVGGAIALIVAILFFDAGAIFPLTKKYKALSKEYEELEAQKQQKKSEKAQAYALKKAEERKAGKKEE
ncbi:MAG: signal peptidase II [Clostridia bacterium]|nr:signal peptidase II [Clostridia bacterium]